MMIVLFVLWCVVGMASFVYWHTKHYDFCWSDIPFALIVSAMGVVAFFVGWVIHGDPTKETVIFKKKK